MNRWRDLSRRAAAHAAIGDRDEFDEFDKSKEVSGGNELGQQRCEARSETFSTNPARPAAMGGFGGRIVEKVAETMEDESLINHLKEKDFLDLSNSSNLSPTITGISMPDGERFDERAAIMEFDGGLPRAEAEARAAAEEGFESVIAWRTAAER